MIILSQSSHNPIKDFTIMAERHCGTNFIEKYMNKVYGLKNNTEYGPKHFFGFNDKYILDHSDNTIIIGIVRNPYDWLMAMYNKPWHMRKCDGHPNPMDTLEKLLTKKIRNFWKNKEMSYDRHIKEHRLYKDIFELREDKHNYLLETLPKLAKNYILINYETLCNNIKLFTDNLNQNFSIKINHLDNSFIQKKYTIPDETTLNTINAKLIWKTENILGYYPLKYEA